MTASSVSYAVPTIQWQSDTEMDSEKKDQILFALFSAESKGLTGRDKLIYVINNMISLHGKHWSGFTNGNTDFDYIASNVESLAKFKYEEKLWVIFQHVTIARCVSNPNA